MFNKALIWAAGWLIFAGYVNGASGEDKSKIISACKICTLFKLNTFIALCSTRLEHIVLQRTHEDITCAVVINIYTKTVSCKSVTLCAIAHLFIQPFLVQSTGPKHFLKWTEFRCLSSSEKFFCNKYHVNGQIDAVQVALLPCISLFKNLEHIRSSESACK